MKLRLKNETASTASLEHEAVECQLSRFLFYCHVGVKIATKGANSIYSSHIKKTPSVLMYMELKIVTVLSYFIFVYSMNCAY
jgi:hypothetical protein